jgi:hypothetical protein
MSCVTATSPGVESLLVRPLSGAFSAPRDRALIHIFESEPAARIMKALQAPDVYSELSKTFDDEGLK